MTVAVLVFGRETLVSAVCFFFSTFSFFTMLVLAFPAFTVLVDFVGVVVVFGDDNAVDEDDIAAVVVAVVVAVVTVGVADDVAGSMISLNIGMSFGAETKEIQLQSLVYLFIYFERGAHTLTNLLLAHRNWYYPSFC